MSLTDLSELSTDFLLLGDDQERAATPDALPADGDGRTLLVRLLRWDEVATTPQGREAFARRAFDGLDPSTILLESQAHGGAIVGRGEALDDDGEGPLLRARVSRTTAGDDLLTLVRDGVLKAASISFKPEVSRRRKDGVIERLKATVRKVAILPSGAYPSAQVLATRGVHDMTEDTTQVQELVAAPAVDLQPVLDRMDAMDEALARVAAGAAYGGQAGSDTLERFDSFQEAFMAATTDPEVASQLHRLFADNVLDPDNPGLNRPSWLGRVVDRVTWGRPTVNAFGTEAPGDTGLTVQWPVFDDTSTFKVDVQSKEKAEISTGTTKYKVASEDLVTVAGGADNSLQLLERSTPSFRELLLRNYAAEYAIKTNALMVAALEAGGATFTGGLDISSTVTSSEAKVEAILAALFGASLAVETATGEPANVVLAATDVFTALGGLPGLWPSAYGTQNVGGTAQASTLQVNVSGLSVRHDRALTDGNLIVAQSSAATYFEDGPRTIEALNVQKLGRDIAIYGYGAPAIFRAGGVQVVAVTL